MMRYTKILLPQPRTTPSEEATGGGVSRFAKAIPLYLQTAHQGGLYEERSILDFQSLRELSTVFPQKRLNAKKII